MIVVSVTGTADNTDVLSGTDLNNIPGPGLLVIFAASTVNDTVMTITGPNAEPLVRAQKLQQRTNGMPIMSDDLPYLLPVIQGGKVFVNVDITGAATWNVITMFFYPDEL